VAGHGLLDVVVGEVRQRLFGGASGSCLLLRGGLGTTATAGMAASLADPQTTSAAPGLLLVDLPAPRLGAAGPGTDDAPGHVLLVTEPGDVGAGRVLDDVLRSNGGVFEDQHALPGRHVDRLADLVP